MLPSMRNDTNPSPVPAAYRPQAIHPDELWTVEEVARFFRVSRSWVYKASSRGDLPCIRIGPMLRFHPLAVRGLASGPQPSAMSAPLEIIAPTLKQEER